MHLRSWIGALACAFAVASTGCRKDAEVDAFVDEYDGVAKEIVKDVEEAGGKADGVEAARRALEDKRDDLVRRWEELHRVRQYQVGSTARARLEETVTRDVSVVRALEIKYRGEPGVDDAELGQLVADFVHLTDG